jgi:hypothetical protein
MSELARELRDNYPAVDVTTVIFSADLAGVGCCVIPQDRVIAITDEIEQLQRDLSHAKAMATVWMNRALKAEPSPQVNAGAAS